MTNLPQGWEVKRLARQVKSLQVQHLVRVMLSFMGKIIHFLSQAISSKDIF